MRWRCDQIDFPVYFIPTSSCPPPGGVGSCCVPWPCSWSSSPCSPSLRSFRPATRRRREGKNWVWTTCPATTTSSRRRATTRARRSPPPWASERTSKVEDKGCSTAATPANVADIVSLELITADQQIIDVQMFKYFYLLFKHSWAPAPPVWTLTVFCTT